MPGLPNDPVRAGGIRRPQNRSDVVRILDPVEHDEKRRRRSRPVDELLQTVIARRVELRHDSLVHAPARGLLDRRRVDALDPDPLRARESERLFDAAIARAAPPAPAARVRCAGPRGPG